MKNKIEKILLGLILLLALFLRIYKLEEISGSLNPDEVALGYTSYSLLRTGADEHGKFLPLVLQSFGDWKMPVYSYVGVIPVALFGLSEFSTRFTSVIAGVTSVLLLYFISWLLFKKKSVALLTGLFLALSPWSLYFSRAAYEVNLATAIFLGGLLTFLIYTLGKQKKVRLLVIASFLFGLSMFTQHNFLVFSPLMVSALIVLFRKIIIWRRASFLAFGVFLVLAFLAYLPSMFEGGNKISTLLVLNDKNILYDRVEKLRGDNAPKNQFLERIIHNKYIGIPYQICQNYLSAFSPSFLFDKGGEKLVHNLGSYGNFYLFDAFLLFVGLAGLFWNKEAATKVLLFWLLISPLPSVLTRDTANSTRLFSMTPLFVLVSAYGAYEILFFLKEKSTVGYLAGGLLSCFFILNVTLFLEAYFVHFNTQRVRFWHYGYREAVKLTQKYPEYKVVMRGPENFPYIYFLFYEKYDPLRFRKEAQYYPPTSEGFYYVKSFGRYHFVELIDYNKLEPKTIYIDDTRLDDKDSSIFLPSGEPILGYHIKGEK